MTARYRNLLLLSTTLLLLAGCGQTFSPYLMLPKAPMQPDEVQVVAGVAGMPNISNVWPGATSGEMGIIRYGVTDHLSLQAGAWTDAFPGLYPVGFSLEGIDLLSSSQAPWRFAIVPEVAVMNSGIELHGWGGELALAAWTPDLLGGHPYFAVGAIGGAASSNGDGYDVGFGGTANAGIEYDVFDHVSLNAETSVPLVVVRESSGHYFWNGFWVMGIAAGYHF